ncbi:MAG: hypothetical protein V4541_01135 [Bacteroidota bacterium]
MNLSKDQQAILAIPEKALCDKIVITAGITLRSQSSARDYVFGNLRMEEEDLAKFDVNEMLSWLESAPKRESLEMLIKMIEKI